MRNPYSTSVGFIEHPEGKDISQMTLGQVKQYGRYLIDQTRGRADLGLPEHLGSSAKGAYQMTNPFLQDWAGSLYGDEYKDKVFNKETQDEVMRHYLSNVDEKRVYRDFQGLQKAEITPDRISQLNDDDLLEAIRATETGSGIKKGWLDSRLKQNPSEQGLASESVIHIAPPEKKPVEDLNQFAARNPDSIPSTSTAGNGMGKTAPANNRERGTNDVELLSYYSPEDLEGLAKKAQEEALKERKEKLSQSFNGVSKSLQNMGLNSNTNLAYNTASQNTPTKSKKISSNNRLHF